jgi:hypothetical protein
VLIGDIFHLPPLLFLALFVHNLLHLDISCTRKGSTYGVPIGVISDASPEGVQNGEDTRGRNVVELLDANFAVDG